MFPRTTPPPLPPSPAASDSPPMPVGQDACSTPPLLARWRGRLLRLRRRRRRRPPPPPTHSPFAGRLARRSFGSTPPLLARWSALYVNPDPPHTFSTFCPPVGAEVSPRLPPRLPVGMEVFSATSPSLLVGTVAWLDRPAPCAARGGAHSMDIVVKLKGRQPPRVSLPSRPGRRRWEWGSKPRPTAHNRAAPPSSPPAPPGEWPPERELSPPPGKLHNGRNTFSLTPCNCTGVKPKSLRGISPAPQSGLGEQGLFRYVSFSSSLVTPLLKPATCVVRRRCGGDPRLRKRRLLPPAGLALLPTCLFLCIDQVVSETSVLYRVGNGARNSCAHKAPIVSFPEVSARLFLTYWSRQLVAESSKHNKPVSNMIHIYVL
ncbi:hypothetical protein CALCODRAFT_27025 [Calocera cornea HHB12733]|uniref:Uncharacterized protein n=1 Tax=Calocera cornea HHB12733 TaxID=1353952 RepID=A0A165J3Z5_9BASI|nr:hypothetical protein CALCODRAFT_27025 [Calocera cornea HHB12733]